MDEEIPKYFLPNERLYRAVPLYVPANQIKEDGTFSSVIFKQSTGASVDRQWKRSREEAIDTLRKSQAQKAQKMEEEFAVVSVTVADCDAVKAKCIYSPINENIYHSEILRSESKNQLTSSQARKLAQRCHREI